MSSKLRRILCIILALSLFFALDASAQNIVYSEGPIADERGMVLSGPVGKSVLIMVNDTLLPIDMKAYPTIDRSVAYAPLPMLAKGLGAQLNQVGKQSYEVVGPDGFIIVYNFDLKTVTPKNGEKIELQVIHKNETPMVPVKWLAEQLGFQCAFLPTAPLIRIFDGKQTVEDNQIYSTFGEEIELVKAKLRAAIEQETKEQLEKQKKKNSRLKVIYLTFDDGPGPYTQSILDTLRGYNMQATFFLVGNKILKYPSLAVKIKEQGEGLGLHGMTHVYSTFYSSADGPLNEMKQGNGILEKVVGASSRLVRVPYGSYPYLTKEMYSRLSKAGFIVWDWNIDSMDSRVGATDPGAIAKSVIDDIRRKGKGSVVLMHEKKATAQALEIICKWMSKNGYTSNIITEDITPVNWTERLK